MRLYGEGDTHNQPNDITNIIPMDEQLETETDRRRIAELLNITNEDGGHKQDS